MKVSSSGQTRICPICGCEYSERPALSREDNSTPICSACGVRQALYSLGISAEDAERILDMVRAHDGGAE